MTPDETIRLAGDRFTEGDADAVRKAMLRGEVTMGKAVVEFETRFADRFLRPSQEATMVNSGSSANLLMANALRRLYPDGGEVIVPAIGWSTTYAPFLQHGFTLRAVDIAADGYTIDPDRVRRAICEDTVAVVAVHLLGLPCDMDALADACETSGAVLLEDCCEALGATYHGDPVGSFGRLASFSTYYSHQLTTIEGGILAHRHTDTYPRAARSHGWTRDLEDDDQHRLEEQYPSIDPAFLFAVPGYNVKPTEIQGILGRRGMETIDRDLADRATVARWYRHNLPDEMVSHLPDSLAGASIQYFPVDLGDRPALEVLHRLRVEGIECRPVMTGNVTRQPFVKPAADRVLSHGRLRQADRVHDHHILIPCHPGLSKHDLGTVRDKLREAVEEVDEV